MFNSIFCCIYTNNVTNFKLSTFMFLHDNKHKTTYLSTMFYLLFTANRYKEFVMSVEFMEKLNQLASKIKQQSGATETEEATKNAFVMPFINNVLGYDVFDPTEVIPEFVCDVGTKKGEKIDYAILKNGEVQILIECKKIGEPLNINHASQLFRYFHVTNARISILTNGQEYKFFTDLDAPNKMDEKPFLEINLLDLDEMVISEIKKLTKSAFDLESILNAAGELKYVSLIKNTFIRN